MASFLVWQKRSDGIADTEGTFIRIELRLEVQSLQEAGHDLEGRKAAFRRLLDQIRIQLKESSQVAAGEDGLNGRIKGRSLGPVAVGAIFFQNMGEVAAGHIDQAAAQGLGGRSQDPADLAMCLTRQAGDTYQDQLEVSIAFVDKTQGNQAAMVQAFSPDRLKG